MVRFAKEEKDPIRVSLEVIGRIVSKLVDFTYLQDLQPTYIGVIIHLLSTMDIPVGIMGLQKLVVWRSENPAIQSQTPP